MRVLVTGGCGYIGSHTVLELIKNKHEVIVIDNLINSSQECLNRIKNITGKSLTFYKVDLCSDNELEKFFSENQIDGVMHFAGLKAVGESSVIPIKYYSNNLNGAINLLDKMTKYNVNNLIFSSSATVYGEDAEIPYMEEMKLGNPSSPYGATKLMIERIISDHAKAHPHFKAVILRYFNPIGAHPSGLIGEDPKGIPNNLLPFILQVASGRRESLKIFGKDYPTEDGTCKRDYIHIVDLADGHLSALNWLEKQSNFSGTEIFNLGTGKATSVLEIIHTFENQTGIKIKYEFTKRRAGDLPEFWADNSKALKVLRWNPNSSLKEMMIDSWNWQSKNPDGYE